MEEKDNKGQLAHEVKISAEDFLLYPGSKDIYSQLQEDGNIDVEDISAINETNGNIKTGNDLDVPGSELDDAQENIGSEDEENNYYSIGGDNHNDLEEDNRE